MKIKKLSLSKESIIQFGLLNQVVGGDNGTVYDHDGIPGRETTLCTQPAITCACNKQSLNCCEHV